MKTIIYSAALYLTLQFNLSAQVNRYQLDDFQTENSITKNDCDKLKPVYYNFSKRRLYANNKMPINGRHFLDLCRGINDSRLQHQIRRYDQLTSNKKKMIVASIVCGVGGYLTLVYSAMMATSSYAADRHYVGIGVGAASLFVATPILAFSTAIPHAKRKEILFRDLPEAYNFHVLSQTNQ